MVLEEVTSCYQKPFNLFHYNKAKQPDFKQRKGPIDYRAAPKIPIKWTNASKMRSKVIKQYMETNIDPFEDLRDRLTESGRLILQEPEVIPRDNKTSNYRYKWAREVPVVSCRFTEHVMMFKKPPFTYDLFTQKRCGEYRLRNLEIKDPEREEVIPEEEKTDLVPSILM